MNLSTLVDNLYHNTVSVSLPLFRPELILCATIVAMLLVRIIAGTRIPAALVALVGSAIALYYAALPFAADDIARTEIFTGLLVYDGFTVVFG